MLGLCNRCSVSENLLTYTSGVLGQGCGCCLNSMGGDHDAGPSASLQKADQAFLQVTSHFTFSLKGHQKSCVETIPHKSKGTRNNELIGCLNVTLDRSI